MCKGPTFRWGHVNRNKGLGLEHIFLEDPVQYTTRHLFPHKTKHIKDPCRTIFCFSFQLHLYFSCSVLDYIQALLCLWTCDWVTPKEDVKVGGQEECVPSSPGYLHSLALSVVSILPPNTTNLVRWPLLYGFSLSVCPLAPGLGWQ